MEMSELQKLSVDEMRKLVLSLAEWVEIHNSPAFTKEQRILALVKIDDFVGPAANYEYWTKLHYAKTSTILLDELALEKMGISKLKYVIAELVRDEEILQRMYSILELYP